jgi:hypothetical protein
VENQNLKSCSYHRFVLIFFLWFVFVSPVFAWGNQAHRIINQESVKDLPDAMQGFKEKDFYLSDYASEADRRAVADEYEIPKHFSRREGTNSSLMPRIWPVGSIFFAFSMEIRPRREK